MIVWGRHKHGFTLLELLITMVLLVVGVVSVVGALSAGFAADQNVGSQAVALGLAQEGMESVKAANFNSVVAQARAAVSGFDGYDREVTVSGTDLKHVMVSIYWTFKGQEQHVDLDTLITEPAP
jgi:prepilin-type N-terminal cleavage/methylation domain-containing protein